MKHKVLIALGLALAAVMAVGGYSFGATKAAPVDTACVTAKNVLSHIYARSVSCPRGQHKVEWNQQGKEGPAGAGDIYESVAAPIPGGQDETSSTVMCPTGWVDVSGGFENPSAATVTFSGPASVGVSAGVTEYGWKVEVATPVEGLSAFATCAEPTPQPSAN